MNNSPEIVDEKSLNNLCTEIQAIDRELMPQLKRLAIDIPEVYAQYANLTMEIASSVLEIIKPNGATAAGVAVAAELTARSFRAFGAYKAAVKHNRLLTKMLETKRSIALANHEKIKYVIPKIERNLNSCTKLFDKILNSTYDLRGVPDENINRMTGINLRVLNIYRMACYFKSLAYYLDQEYSSWESGSQTSGLNLPDMHSTNTQVLKHINASSPFNALSQALARHGVLSGREYVLIAEPQLTMMALKSKWVIVNDKSAHPGIMSIIDNNPAFAEYNKYSKKVKRHILFSPILLVALMAVISIIAILYICYTFQSTETWKTLALVGLSVLAVLRIAIAGTKKLQIACMQVGDDLIESSKQKMEIYCGKIIVEKFDYSIKNARSEMWSTFKS